MKTIIIFFFTNVIALNVAFSQGTAINTTGTNADASAMLDVNSTTKGMLVPRMTEAEKNAVSNPANGLLIYQTNGVTGFWYYNGTVWVQAIGPVGAIGATGPTGANGSLNAWGLKGSAGTNSGTNFIGTTDNASLQIKTNNTAQVIIDSSGKVGIGTTAPSPSAKLDISSPSQGLLIPRVGLTGTTDNVTVPNPAVSLLAYNNGATIPKGFYYNAGTPSSPVWSLVGADNLGNHTATQNLNLSGKKISNLATCTQNSDAANKEYVDSAVAAGGGAVNKPFMISNESPIAYTLSGAVQYCENLSENGYSDWRLPIFDELAYFFGSSSSTDYLWTKSMAKGKEDATLQYYVSARLSDGKFRNGTDLSNPFIGNGVSGSTTNTSWANLATINPVTSGNWLMLTDIQLQGMNVSGYTSYFRIRFNYASGAILYSNSFFQPNSLPQIIYTWNNIEQPIALTSISVEGYSSSSSYTTRGYLTVSGYETPPQVQKDGNSLFCRCVR